MYKRTLKSAKVNVVAVASSYVMVTTNACRCVTITSDHARACIVATRVLAVIYHASHLCVVLYNLTLVRWPIRSLRDCT